VAHSLDRLPSRISDFINFLSIYRAAYSILSSKLTEGDHVCLFQVTVPQVSPRMEPISSPSPLTRQTRPDSFQPKVVELYQQLFSVRSLLSIRLEYVFMFSNVRSVITSRCRRAFGRNCSSSRRTRANFERPWNP
jgi:hypothetical protein